MTVPSVDQRTKALKRANEIRLGRAQLKRDLYAMPTQEGVARVSELVADPPEDIKGMRVLELLSAPYRMGRHRAMGMLRRAGVPESKQIGELTDRQRGAVRVELAAAGERSEFERRKRERLAARANGNGRAA